MGQILSAHEITKNNIETYIKNSTVDYSKFLNSAPTFVLYYSKNSFETTYDNTFEAVNEVVGAESPVKFNKIKDFPLYSIQNSSFGTDITDFGISTDVSSSAIILPNTIKPEVDDFFTLFYDGNVRLYRVSNIEVDSYRSTTYYKITFYLSSSSINDIDLQTEKTLHVDYENIGKSKNPFTEENKYDIYQDLKKIFDGLLENFLYNYYDDKSHSLVNKYFSTIYTTDLFVMDTNVNYFINENKLNSFFNKFREFNYIHRDLLNKIERPLYRKTIYYNLNEPVNTLSSKVLANKIKLVPERGLLYSNSWRLRKTYVNTETKLNTYIPLSNEDVIEYLSNTLLTKISSNDITGINKYEEIIVKYYNNYYNSTTRYLEFIDDFNYLEDYESNYYVLPLVLYIGKHFIELLSSNP